MFFNNLRKFLSFFVFLFLSLFAFSVHANIDNTDKFARFLYDNSFINLNAANGNVSVSDSALSGFAWGENVGWINFNPTNGGIINDGNGNLSGFAWGENVGWINFNPTNGGVAIDNDGYFHGYAWSEARGWIVFNCDTDNSCSAYDHKVRTSWRPISSVFSLTVNKTGGGSGSVISDPAGINCGNVCAADFNISTIVVLTANPSTNSNFGDWSGCDSVNQNECTVNISSDRTVSVSFDAKGSSGGGGPTDPPDDEEEETPIFGCLDSDALNFNPSANRADGSCVYEPDDETPIDPEVPEEPEEPTEEPPVDDPEDPEEPSLPGGDPEDPGSPDFPPQIFPQIDIPEAVNEIVEAIAVLAAEPAVSALTKTVSLAGAAAGVVATALALAAAPFSLIEILLLPFRLLALILSFLGFRKKSKPWGVVYDSVTKQPLDPAYVVLTDINGNELLTSITDLDGRYGFLTKPGEYKIVANKTNYAFPSQKLAGHNSDNLYENLYFGDKFMIGENGLVAQNIPMDPIKFDWNEFAKRDKRIMRFYSKFDFLFGRFADAFFVFGFIVAVFSLFFAPDPYNVIIFGLYVLLILLRILGIKPRPHGNLIDRETGDPLSFAIVRVFYSDLNTEAKKVVCDSLGRYYCLVPKGNYYITVEKKNIDESYTKIFTSGIIKAKKGIIKERFKI